MRSLAPNSEDQSFCTELHELILFIPFYQSAFMSYFSHLQKTVNLYPKHFNKKLNLLSHSFFFLALVYYEFEHMTFIVGEQRAKVLPYGKKYSGCERLQILLPGRKKRLGQLTYYTRSNKLYCWRALEHAVVPGVVLVSTMGWTWQT